MSQFLYQNSVSELIKMFKDRKTNPVELVKDIIKNIKKNNPHLNAFVEYDEEKIIKQAEVSEIRWNKKNPISFLDGIPISIKDLIITKDYPTRRGSYVESLPIYSKKDAPVVRKLKKAGAIIIGKTTTPEFGHKGTTQSNRYGVTRNPWNKKLNAGGSSGGSASAVAAGLGQLSIGTDGGGSVRIPCSFCGLFGHKPTFGRIPAYPISPFGTVANIGPISRCVKDSGLLMNIIATPDKDDWYSLPNEYNNYEKNDLEQVKSLRIGITKYWGMKHFLPDLELSEEVEKGFDEAMKALRNENINLIEDEKILWPNNPEKIFKIMWYSGAANLSKKINKKEFSKIDQNFQIFIERGNKFSMFEFMDAEAKRSENATYLSYFFDNYDVIIGPTMPVLAFNAENTVPTNSDDKDIFSWTPFTYPFNLTKNPASTINCGFSNSGLPVGIQVVAPHYEDKRCFLISAYLEKIFSITNKWPKNI